MELRRLTMTDLESCFRCRLRALRDTPSAFLTTVAEEEVRGPERYVSILSASDPNLVLFGALDQGEVVGMVGVSRETRAKLNHRALVWGMHVDVTHRRQGLGGQLIDLAIRHAREEFHSAVVSLIVESSNTSSRQLYESRGFQCWGTEPYAAREGDGRFTSEDHMYLRLT